MLRLDLLADWARKYFPGQSAGRTSSGTYWKWFGKNKCSGSSALEVNFRPKYRIVFASSLWVSEDGQQCNNVTKNAWYCVLKQIILHKSDGCRENIQRCKSFSIAVHLMQPVRILYKSFMWQKYFSLTSKIPRKEESLIFSSIQLPGLLRSEIGRSGIKNNVANSIMTNSTSNPNKAGNF